MKIKLPSAVVRLFDLFTGWLNDTLYQRGWFEVRRVDIIVATLGISSVIWNYSIGGWLGALRAMLLFVFAMMCSLWFF